jgi:hypothetical protein
MTTQINSLADLFRTIKQYTTDPFDIIENAYWWLVENHHGQGSWEYTAGSRLNRVYTPSPCCNGPENPVPALFDIED